MRTEKVSTCSQAIRKRRNALEIKRGYIQLVLRIAILSVAGWLLFTQVFFVGQAPDHEMAPAVEAGDLLIDFGCRGTLKKMT